MRYICILSFCFALASMAVGQDTDTSFPVGPQYLVTAPPGSILQSIETPSVSPDQTTGEVSPRTGEAVPVALPNVSGPANLAAIYWGMPSQVEQVIEVSSPNSLPTGYIDTGVTELVSDRALLAKGYGVSLAEAARYWKEHRLRAKHLYTNQDLERLPNS